MVCLFVHSFIVTNLNKSLCELKIEGMEDGGFIGELREEPIGFQILQPILHNGCLHLVGEPCFAQTYPILCKLPFCRCWAGWESATLFLGHLWWGNGPPSNRVTVFWHITTQTKKHKMLARILSNLLLLSCTYLAVVGLSCACGQWHCQCFTLCKLCWWLLFGVLHPYWHFHDHWRFRSSLEIQAFVEHETYIMVVYWSERWKSCRY